MHADGIFAEIEHEIGGYVYRDGSLEGLRLDSAAEAQSDRYEIYTGVKAAMEDFIGAVRSGGAAESNFFDAAKTMDVAYQIHAADILENT
jgi:hypothetical protein